MILYDHHFKYANWKHLFHIQRKRKKNVYMSLLKSNIEGIFSNYVFGKCLFWTFRELKVIIGHRDIYYAKKY